MGTPGTDGGARPEGAGWGLPVVTLIGVAVAIVTAFLGSGALGGTPIAEAAGGALSADATPIAPAGPAFGIWSIIYVGLAGYALWQLTPAARSSPRHRALRPWILGSALLNAAWIWSVQFGLLVISVLVIVVLLGVLIRTMYLLAAPRTEGVAEFVLTDGTIGLYLGWVSVAALANVYALLVDAGVAAFSEIALGVVGVAVATGIGLATAWLSRGRLAPAVATAWGLAWVAAGRTEGAFAAEVLVWTAAAGAGVVLVSALAGALLTAKGRTERRTGEADADATRGRGASLR